MPPPLLYLIADLGRSAYVEPVCRAVRTRHGPGEVRLAFQLRDKRATARALFEGCRAWARSIHANGGRILVNERADVALAGGADGVHLSKESLSLVEARRLPGELILAYSAHDAEEAARARADIVTLSPIYETPEKGAPIGLNPLEKAAVLKRGGDLLALGGITEERIPDVLAAGATGIAVIGAVFGTDDPPRAAARLAAALVKNWRR